MILNTQEILNSIQDKALSWAENLVKVQKEKCGNEDIFEAIIGHDEIVFFCGESRGEFIYNEGNKKWVFDYGNLYHPAMCQEIVNQLAQKFSQKNDSEFCQTGTLRYKVAQFLMSNRNLARFSGDKYFEVEDDLVDFISNLK